MLYLFLRRKLDCERTLKAREQASEETRNVTDLGSRPAPPPRNAAIVLVRHTRKRKLSGRRQKTHTNTLMLPHTWKEELPRADRHTESGSCEHLLGVHLRIHHGSLTWTCCSTDFRT